MAMAVFRRLLAKARSLFSNREANSDFETEIQDHLKLLTERYIRQGMSPEAADQTARRQFGNTTLLREERREILAIAAIDAFGRDLRYATRMLRRNPAFAGAVVLTLALGIGANTAIFSVYDAVILKPLPYGDPERLVMLWEKQRDGHLGTVAPANFVDWRAQASSFSEMAALNPFSNFILTGYGEPARLAGTAVSSNFFRLLGIRMKMGRDFLTEEDQPGKDRVVVVSYSTWLNRLGGNPEILGSSMTLNDLSYTVVGVLGPDFELVTNHSRNQPDVWVPLALNLEKLQRGTHPLRVFAQIKPGMAFHQMQADLNVVGANLASLYPEDNKDKEIAAVPLDQQVTEKVRTALTTLLVGVGLLLLIACANVANLLLSRAAARQKEMAVRLALGASRRSLAQQLLTESVLLSLLGGALGLFLAYAAIRLLGPHLPADLPRISTLSVDLRVLVFTASISLATGILFGLAPLFQTKRGNASETLKHHARIASGQSRLRSGLVMAQMAIALVLLTGAALTAKSFWNLLQVSPGFRTEHILTARVSLPASRYPDVSRIATFQSQVLERVRNLPGIQSAGLTAYLPLSGADNGWAFFIEGRPPLPVGVYNMAKYRPVSPGYFETIGIPLLRGRSFTAADSENAPLVVIINQSMARAYWGQENPVGQRLRFGGPGMRTIAGVVGDVRHEGLDGEAKPEMYVPFTQIPNTERRPTIVVRTSLDSAAVTAGLRQEISAVDSGLPLDQIETMEHLVSSSVGQPRFRTILLGAFSILALVIASVGIYGVMTYLVSQRIQEFGIRLAIGATPGDVLRLVLRQASVLIAGGICLGLLGSAILARLITGLLYGVSALDPLTFAAVSMLLSVLALLASYLPARRATRVDPLTALRYE